MGYEKFCTKILPRKLKLLLVLLFTYVDTNYYGLE